MRRMKHACYSFKCFYQMLLPNGQELKKRSNDASVATMVSIPVVILVVVFAVLLVRRHLNTYGTDKDQSQHLDSNLHATSRSGGRHSRNSNRGVGQQTPVAPVGLNAPSEQLPVYTPRDLQTSPKLESVVFSATHNSLAREGPSSSAPTAIPAVPPPVYRP